MEFPRPDPHTWSTELGVSVDACSLLLEADFIDAHLDLHVPVRLFGTDPAKKRAPTPLPPRFWGHTDFPRLRQAGFTGAVYDIATNPLRPPRNRLLATLRNIDDAIARMNAHSEDLSFVTSHSEYQAARAAGKLAFWISLQGGNALLHDPGVLDGETGSRLHRITLVHLTRSAFGGTSSPLGGDGGLSTAGQAFIERCNHRRILVDLAHAGKRTFWASLDVHSRLLPPIVSHTGVSTVHPHWRNLDDDQIRAIADRGGIVGIMYQSAFLERTWPFGRGSRRAILDHLEHVLEVGGEGAAAIGTDYDGAIVPPADLPDVTAHPLLVQDMLDRHWPVDRIEKVLGRNYLRVVKMVRP